MPDQPGIGGASSFRHTKDSTLTSFLDLGLSEPITRALVDEQYATPTPIQAQTIPQVLAARDVVGIAQTGTGKTAAFALPILNHLAASGRPQPRSCRVLVLSPTRELSAQIVDSFQTYGRYLRPRVALAIGGVPINRQIRALTNGVDVLVATPGRLLDLMQSRAVQLDRVEVFVLDEADRMLDMGFIHDIRRIVTKLPSKRQTLFFSATMPREIADLASHMLRDPVRVAVTPAATTVERIEQRVIHVDRAGKPGLLAEVLREKSVERVLVFTRTKRGADKVVRALAKAGLASEAIHGNKSQNQRERVLAAFRAGHVRTLVATDIAARGADGIAISFCEAEERPFLRDIEKLIRMSIPAGEHSSDRRSPAPPREHHANGSRLPQQQRKQHANGQHRDRPERKPETNAANRHRRPAQAPAAAHGGEIGAIAFMQPKRGGQRHRGAYAGRRAPR